MIRYYELPSLQTFAEEILSRTPQSSEDAIRLKITLAAPAGRPISLGLEEKEDATPRRFGFTTRCDTIGSWKDARKEGRFRFAGWSSPTPTPTDCCQYESPFNMAWNFKQKASRGEGRSSVG